MEKLAQDFVMNKVAVLSLGRRAYSSSLLFTIQQIFRQPAVLARMVAFVWLSICDGFKF